jgi:hypothetical protein
MEHIQFIIRRFLGLERIDGMSNGWERDSRQSKCSAVEVQGSTN